MELAKSSQYAVLGLVHLAGKGYPGEPVQLHDIAVAVGAPEAFLSKIFQGLRAAGLVMSHRGVVRGYTLARAPGEISLHDVMVATSGHASVHTPGLASEQPGAALVDVWQELEAIIASRLRSTTLEDLM